MFAGLQIASGPLYYNGTSYEIKDSWNYSSYNSTCGKNEGSTYFTPIQMGELFEKEGYTTSDGDIDNLLDPFDGWRLPTNTELEEIFGVEEDGQFWSERTGSTVNGRSRAFWSDVRVSDVTFPDKTVLGLLLYPDGEIIAGAEIDNFNGTSMNAFSLTKNELNEYISQGCAFLPMTCLFNSSQQYSDQSRNTLIISSKQRNPSTINALSFDDNISVGYSYGYYNFYYMIRLVKGE